MNREPDPIADMRRAIERIKNDPGRRQHICAVDGHITQFGSLRCPVCLAKIRETISEEEWILFDHL